MIRHSLKQLVSQNDYRTRLRILGVLFIISATCPIFYGMYVERIELTIYGVLLYYVGALLNIPYKRNREELLIKQGKRTGVIYNYDSFDTGALFISGLSLIFVVIGLVNLNNPDSTTVSELIIGFYFFGNPFLPASRYFLLLDGQVLTIRGSQIPIRKISSIQIENDTIIIHKGSTEKSFSMSKLDESERNEVRQFLEHSILQDLILST